MVGVVFTTLPGAPRSSLRAVLQACAVGGRCCRSTTRRGRAWQPVRRSRRSKRLEAIRAAVQAVGAPPQANAEATAMVLRLSGADASWPLHDSYGLPLDRIPDVIAHTVELIIRDLRTHVTADTPA